MAVRTPTELKSFFEQGDFPTQAQFGDLIDSITSGGNFLPYTGATSNTNTGIYTLTSTSFIKTGGSSSQFLKADGSSDSSSYIPYIGADETINLNNQNLINVKQLTVGSTNISNAKAYIINTDDTLNGFQVASTITDVTSDKDGSRIILSITPTADIDSAAQFATLNVFGTQNNTTPDNGLNCSSLHAFNNSTAGTIANFGGERIAIRNLSTGTITNAFGTKVVTHTNSGTIANFYGVIVEAQTGATILNVGYTSRIASGSGMWNFYAEGTASNYFAGNIGLGTTEFGTNAASTLSVFKAAPPSTSPVDCFQLYTDDIIPGNSAPFFRTEAGDIIKLFTGAALTAPLATVTFTAGSDDHAWGAGTNSSSWGFTSQDEFKTMAATIANLQIRLNQVEARMQAAGQIS